MRKAWIVGALIVAAGLWTAQSRLSAPLSVEPPPMPAPLEAFADDPPVQSAQDWVVRRAPRLRQAFESLVYGVFPEPAEPFILSRRTIDTEAFGGLGRIDEITVSLAAPGNQATAFSLLLVTPNGLSEPAPVVVAPNFCGNHAALGRRYPALQDPAWIAPRCRTSASRAITRAIAGANIVRPPFADLLKDGFAIASFSPGEILPDDPELARAAFERLPAAPDRLGAIGAWAWSISRVIDVLERDVQLDHQRIAVFGHSRFGKAALWATAVDARIALVIANQSGRLGASSSGSRVGEPLPRLIERFPHWFPETIDAEAVQAGVDQNLLLALIAPRPILLGGARYDRWSDPAGAYAAAQAATPVYRLFGHVGLDQPDIRTPNLEADIAMFVRPGAHGVGDRDWEVARAFLRAHLN